MPALSVLFGLRGVIEGELDVMEGTQFAVIQKGNRVAIGCDGELHRFRSQVGQYCLEVGMHAVLTGAEIHRANGQAFHHCLHLIEGEAISASWIAVAECAREVALVGQPEPKRNSGIGFHRARSGKLRCGDIHEPPFMFGPERCASQWV